MTEETTEGTTDVIIEDLPDHSPLVEETETEIAEDHWAEAVHVLIQDQFLEIEEELEEEVLAQEP